MSGRVAGLEPRASALLAEALEWRILGLLFERPKPGWAAELRELAQESSSSELRELAEAATRASEGEYLAFLGPGGPASPREAGHRRSSDPARVLATLASTYEAFAYEPTREDPHDHVAIEAGFVAYLRLKESFARMRGDEESAELTASAAALFTREHLAAIAEPLALSLESCSAGYLARSAHALLARTGPRPDGLEGDWVPSCFDGSGCDLGCGSASES